LAGFFVSLDYTTSGASCGQLLLTMLDDIFRREQGRVASDTNEELPGEPDPLANLMRSRGSKYAVAGEQAMFVPMRGW